MKIVIVDYEGRPVLTPSGEIDMYSSPMLRKELMGLTGRKVSPLLVDLSAVSYIDSSGIATFVEGLKATMTYGGKLRLVGISEGIRQIFSFSKLDRVFEIYLNLEDAFRGR